MSRLRDVRTGRSKPAKSQLYVDSNLAKLIRRVASAERRELSPLIEDMFVMYLRTTHPNWELDLTPEAEPEAEPETEPEATPKAPARKERRGQGHRDTGKPIPGSAKPGINRRRKKG